MSRRRALVLLESANVLGGVSNSLVMIVIPWLILERTGSPAAAGLAGALAGLPGIVLAPVVGVVVDRVGRKVVSAVSDLLSAVSVALFPVLDLFGALDLTAILVLTVLGAAFDPAGYTARKALIPDVARASGVARDDVNGVHEGVFAAGWVVGPMLGALCIATIGTVGTMWVAFSAFLLASLTVLLIDVPNRAGRDALAVPAEVGAWASSRVGLRALLADRPVWLLTLAVAAIWLIYMPTESVLLPVHFEDAGRPAAFGAVISAMAAGGMVGAFGYGWVARRMNRYRMTAVFMMLTAFSYVPLAFLPSAAVMLLPAFLLGLAWGPLEPLLNSLVQDRFPEDQHGRVYGVQLAIFYAAPPLGQLGAGVAAERYGVQPVLFAVATGLLLMAVTVRLVPALRGLDVVEEPA
ncbi:MAG TPA: MFS transporter [Marmoricola sp.]|nr:MFS transporter [Marmoricola sp.]